MGSGPKALIANQYGLFLCPLFLHPPRSQAPSSVDIQDWALSLNRLWSNLVVDSQFTTIGSGFGRLPSQAAGFEKVRMPVNQQCVTEASGRGASLRHSAQALCWAQYNRVPATMQGRLYSQLLIHWEPDFLRMGLIIHFKIELAVFGLHFAHLKVLLGR